MGFDIECIIDIHNYPGEYFCPVCRTLVYPNEALQSQCTHLYCKPCLAHVANGSRACPYDGYLVTESDSKPLLESDKALAENIGKVKVHCLYFRSGCTWEGTLSDCSLHCSGCSFGNSPVICNRCGVQIVHRQVHDHAQSCPGVSEAHETVGGVSGSSTSNTAAPSAEKNQVVPQSGTQVSQAMSAQTAAGALPAGQNPNQQVAAPSAAPGIAGATLPTPDQWYQQQYQQYYHQYAGYQTYQQPNQPYYPFQQQPYQQYQQNPGQLQSHVQAHGAPQPQLQPQFQSQPNSVPQPLQPPNSQSQPQGQTQMPAQGQDQSQLQPQLPLPQAQPQVQVPTQGQAPAQMPFQSSAPNYHANPQQQPHPPMRPPVHMPSQSLPPAPQGQPTPYSQYQQPQYPQPNVLNHPQASQAPIQHQGHPQPQPASQASNQPHMQIQPQGQMYPTQALPHARPPPNQAPGLAGVPQAVHPPIPHVSGHQSYQQPQPTPPVQLGMSHQNPMHPHPSSGSLLTVHGQAPQPPVVMRPPHSVPPPPPSAPLPLQNQVIGGPPAQYQQLQPPPQQPGYPLQQRPVVQPTQHAVAQQYTPQQPFPVPYQGQMHQQGLFPQQQHLQPQLRPYAPPQPQPAQSYGSRPMMANLGIQHQTTLQLVGGMAPAPSSGPSHPASKPAPTSQYSVEPAGPEQNSAEKETRSPPNGLAGKGYEGETLKPEAVAGQHEIVSDKVEMTANNGLAKSIKQEEDGMQGPLEKASGGKSLESGVGELRDADSLKRADLENQEVKFPKAGVAGSSSTNFKNEPQVGISASSMEGHLRSPHHSHGMNQHRSEENVPVQPSSLLGTQGPGTLPRPAQSFNPLEGRESDYFGTPRKSFESQSAQQGPPPTSLADPGGIVGSAPQLRFEGQVGIHNVARSSDSVMIRDQRSMDGGPFRQTYGNEPNFWRTNGDSYSESSMSGSKDEKSRMVLRDHLHPFMVEPNRPLDHESIDKASHGPNIHARSDLDPSALGRHSRFLHPHHPSAGHGLSNNFGPGNEFGQPHSSFHHGSSTFDDSNGRETRFGDGSMTSNPPSDLVGNPFRDGRFPPLPRRGDIVGPGNHRFGEHVVPGPHHSHFRNNEFFGQDGPHHLIRGEYPGPGYLPGHFNMPDAPGPGGFPAHARETELGGSGNFPGMRSGYSHQGFLNAGNFASGIDSFDQPRKKRPVSTGWCRLCNVDCETVEGLDMHSQTREHQMASLNMVKMIKQQNRKKQRTAGHFTRDGGRTRKVSLENRGNKP